MGGGDTAGQNNPEDLGKMLHGCDHYRRRCKLRAPCCNQIFPCRHCHNEATSALSSPRERHKLARHNVTKVICALCDTEQQAAQVCTNCLVKMGEYFCGICKFYDDDTSKKQFHCDDCGICRVGGRENFFHCQKCGSCYPVDLRDNHACVENSMKNPCPICYEFLFDSLKVTTILKCGHTMHMECYNEMISHNRYDCPICTKLVFSMSRTLKSVKQEGEATVENVPKRTGGSDATGSGRKTSSEGLANMWRDHDMGEGDAQFLRTVEEHFPETFMSVKAKTKLLWHTALDVFCRVVLSFLVTPVTDLITTDDIQAHRDSLLDLESCFGFNVDWALTRLQSIEDLKFGNPLSEELAELKLKKACIEEDIQKLKAALFDVNISLSVKCLEFSQTFGRENLELLDSAMGRGLLPTYQ